MKWLQKLGKSLMLPVTALSVAGVLFGIGCVLCPAVMQGGETVGAISTIGYFSAQAALALIDGTITALLFAVGVAVDMSDDHDGTADLAGFASWLMITHLLVLGVVQTLVGFTDDSIQLMAFGKIQNALIGIIAGIIGSACYNKLKSTKLPDWLTFFSGKCCVAIITAFVSIIATVILLFAWSVVFSRLTFLGEAIVELNVVGAGLYALLNCLLIPFGFHHVPNNIFWFDTTGLGDLTNLRTDKTSTDISWNLGMYMSGLFPCMMFGVPGATLAMVYTTKSNKKKIAIGIVVPAALCAFICGVAELFEFAFMFMAPILYLVYAILYGIFTMTTVVLGFRAGSSLSAGVTDLLSSAALPAATKIWLIILLGTVTLTVFYIVFRFMITKSDLKTPGREGDDEDETTVKLANNDFIVVAAIILEGAGGKENVTSIDNCITRFRLEIKDYTKIDDRKIKSASVVGVTRPSKITVQVIVETQVQFVVGEFKKLCK